MVLRCGEFLAKNSELASVKNKIQEQRDVSTFKGTFRCSYFPKYFILLFPSAFFVNVSTNIGLLKTSSW